MPKTHGLEVKVLVKKSGSQSKKAPKKISGSEGRGGPGSVFLP
jgi:hypothetical protein